MKEGEGEGIESFGEEKEKEGILRIDFQFTLMLSFVSSFLNSELPLLDLIP